MVAILNSIRKHKNHKTVVAWKKNRFCFLSLLPVLPIPVLFLCIHNCHFHSKQQWRVRKKLLNIVSYHVHYCFCYLLMKPSPTLPSQTSMKLNTKRLCYMYLLLIVVFPVTVWQRHQRYFCRKQQQRWRQTVSASCLGS